MLNNHSESVNMDMSIFQSDKDLGGGGLLQEKCKGQRTNKEGYNSNVQSTLSELQLYPWIKITGNPIKGNY